MIEVVGMQRLLGRSSCTCWYITEDPLVPAVKKIKLYGDLNLSKVESYDDIQKEIGLRTKGGD